MGWDDGDEIELVHTLWGSSAAAASVANMSWVMALAMSTMANLDEGMVCETFMKP